MTGSVKKILMLVCGFCVEIGLDLVVAEMYLYCTSRMGSVWFEEFEYSGVNLIVGWIEFI